MSRSPRRSNRCTPVPAVFVVRFQIGQIQPPTAGRSSSVDSVFIPSAISSLPLGTHCAPIAVPPERDDDGIWQAYDNAENPAHGLYPDRAAIPGHQ